MGAPSTRTVVALLAALAALLALPAFAAAAPAEGAGDGVCSASGRDACPAGGAGRLGLEVRDGGARASAIAPPIPGGTALAGPAIFTGYGFDACTAPSSAAMRAWRQSSPFRSVGVYIGGLNRACSQPNLTAAWVREQVAAGWHLIPTYVGLQATTSSCTSCAFLNPAFAAAQGRAEADDAVADAAAIGMGPGSPLYHDMESYTRTSTAVSSTMTFLGAWTKRLHELGYTSGVYSSSASGIRDLAARWGTTFPSPDNIWTANWNGRADTVDPYIPDEAWPDHQRIHQYRGGHDETWGGVRINIDSNYVDAMTVGALGSGTGTPPPPLTVSGIAVRGRILSVKVSCGWSSDLVCPGQIRLRTNVRADVRRNARGRVLSFRLRRVGVAARTFRLRGGNSHRFAVALDTRRGRPLLARRGQLRAQLLVAIPGSRKTSPVIFRR